MKTANLIKTTTATGTLTSPAFDLGDITTYSVYVAFTGSDVVGALTLEASDNNVSYITVASSSQAVATSNDHVWSVTGAGYRWVRVKYVHTSGTGNITADLVAKELRITG